MRVIFLDIVLYREGNEPGDEKTVTYRELLQQVCKFANVLKSQGKTQMLLNCWYKSDQQQVKDLTLMLCIKAMSNVGLFLFFSLCLCRREER